MLSRDKKKKYEELIKNIVKVLDDKKAEDIRIIETSELTIVADCFIVASGTSSTHVRSLSGEVEDALSKLGVEPEFVIINWDTKVFELDSKNIDCIVKKYAIIYKKL